MKKLNPKLIIFDFDGTIADSFEITTEIIHKFSTKFNQKLSYDEIQELIKNIPIKDIMKKFKINYLQLIILLYLVKREVKKIIFDVKPFDDVEDTLKKLKTKGYDLAIMSSNSKKNIELFLDKYNLNQYFNFVISKSSIFGKDKIFNKILKKQNLKNEELIYVGDELRDLVAANKSNINIIILTYGYNSFKLIERENPKYFSNKFSGILKFVK